MKGLFVQDKNQFIQTGRRIILLKTLHSVYIQSDKPRIEKLCRCVKISAILEV